MNDSSANNMAGTVKIIYILYLLGLVTGGLTTLIGVIMAYANRSTAPAWLQTHYRFLIRGFWIGFVYAFLAMLFAITFILIPLAWLMGMFIFIWGIIRCVKGIQVLDKNEAHPKPASWMFG